MTGAHLPESSSETRKLSKEQLAAEIEKRARATFTTMLSDGEMSNEDLRVAFEAEMPPGQLVTINKDDQPEVLLRAALRATAIDLPPDPPAVDNVFLLQKKTNADIALENAYKKLIEEILAEVREKLAIIENQDGLVSTADASALFEYVEPRFGETNLMRLFPEMRAVLPLKHRDAATQAWRLAMLLLTEKAKVEELVTQR